MEHTHQVDMSRPGLNEDKSITFYGYCAECNEWRDLKDSPEDYNKATEKFRQGEGL